MREDTVLDHEFDFFGLGDWILGALLIVILLVIIGMVIRMILKGGK